MSDLNDLEVAEFKQAFDEFDKVIFNQESQFVLKDSYWLLVLGGF